MAEGTGLTASDVALMTRDNNTFGENWIWIIGLLIIAGIFGNGFGFGGNSTGVTEEYIANQFNSRDVWSTNQNVSNTAAATQMEVINNRANCNNNYSNLRYENAMGQANIDKDILLGNQSVQAQMSNLALQNQAQMASCCCDLKTAIHAEGETTRALIQENIIQELRDKVSDKDREALATGLSYSTSLSVRSAKDDILNSLGVYYPRTGVNPYYVYGYTGTTIA